MELAYPKKELATYVKNYWSISGSVAKGKKHIQRIIPDGMLTIYFYASNLPSVKERGFFSIIQFQHVVKLISFMILRLLIV